VLALVQEEVVDSIKEYWRYDPSTNRMGHKLAFPLLPPPKMDKPIGLQLGVRI
jgi:hypothetical protein